MDLIIQSPLPLHRAEFNQLSTGAALPFCLLFHPSMSKSPQQHALQHIHSMLILNVRDQVSHSYKPQYNSAAVTT
jgi:uncharacterized membrane protein